jgi:hypothetical protein
MREDATMGRRAAPAVLFRASRSQQTQCSTTSVALTLLEDPESLRQLFEALEWAVNRINSAAS